jgi:hypothetical protein
MTVLAATVRNTFLDKDATPASPDDFMPDWAAARDDEEGSPYGDDS